MTTEAKTCNIGPGGLIQQDTQNPFLLSREEWLNVQVYVQDSLALPVNNSELSMLLFDDSTTSVDDFKDLLDQFIVLHDHCNIWSTKTFPNTVNLANDIVHYASKVKVYYYALSELVEEYKKKFLSGEMTPDLEEMFKEEMKGCIQLLSQDAKKYADNAENVETEVTTFQNWCITDHQAIVQLYDKYDEKYGDNSDEVKTLRKQIKELKAEKDKLQEKYNRDMIIVATSATYAWVPVFGWIAAGAVDGYYGHEMAGLKKSMNELASKIKEDNRTIKRDTHLMNAIDIAHGSLGKIKTDLDNVIPVIGKIKGIWSAIHSDLGEIQNVIDNDLTQLPPMIKNLAINTAIADWQKVGQEADSFRVNAYAKFQKSNA